MLPIWQAMAFEDGSLVTEAGSGTASKKSERLTSDQELQLADLNWSSPDRHSAPTGSESRQLQAPISPTWRNRPCVTSGMLTASATVVGCCSRSSHRLAEATPGERAGPRRRGEHVVFPC